jgi:hypothetical protein
MNKPSGPAAFRSNMPLYEEDAYGWAMFQAALIRERQAEFLDWDNIAEEIESMGRSEWKSLRSNLMQVILHMMKWDVQPERNGRSWLISINNHRDAALDDLSDNPSLRPQLETIIQEAMVKARKRATNETGLPKGVFDAIHYDRETIFNREHDLPDDR